VAVLRALAVQVLHALLLEGAHGELVAHLLDGSEVWAAYRDQRHDLFLPSGAGQGSSVVGLLEAGGASRYALPAPEAINGA
jgi:DnaJ family protein C protein 13